MDPSGEFNSDYFFVNIDEFKKLRIFLRERGNNFRTNSLDQCKMIRKKILGIEGDLHPQIDLSIGEFVAEYGSVEDFLETPIFEIVPFIALIMFVYTMNVRQGLDPTSPHYFSPERLKELFSNLFNADVNDDSHLLKIFMETFLEAPAEKIVAAIELIDYEYPPPITDDVLQKLQLKLRCYCIRKSIMKGV